MTTLTPKEEAFARAVAMDGIAFFDIADAIEWGETVVTRDPEPGEIVAEAQSVQM